jgi:ribosomal protein S18 acetylase RimI-like enzyme
MKIRKATTQDKEGIANVLKQSYNIKTIEEGINVFEEELKKGHNYIIAKDEEKIVGIVTWTIHDIPKHELAELNRIAVLPEMKGKGAAQQLFDKLVEDAKKFYQSKGHKLRKLYLLTHASNKRAQTFYEKLGFKYETTLKEHYYKGEDEFVYSMFFEK